MESGWEQRQVPAALSAERAADILAPVTPARITAIQRLSGGLANATWRVDVAGRGPLVLRVLLREPSALAKELAAMAAARDQGVPVPEVLHVDPDLPCIVSRWIQGRPLAAVVRAGEPTGSLARRLGHIVACIQRIRFNGVGFLDGRLRLAEDLGDPVAAWRDYLRGSLEGRAGGKLGVELRQAVERVAERATVHVGDGPVLCHADYKPSNIRIGPAGEITVMDWEFAFAGWHLFDVGMMLRYEEDLGSAFARDFERGLREAGIALPDDWRRLALTLDLANLCALLDHQEARPNLEREVRHLVRRTVARLASG